MTDVGYLICRTRAAGQVRVHGACYRVGARACGARG